MSPCKIEYPQKRYVQFNELVLDDYDVLQNATLNGGFKTETQEYSFGNGSYVVFKCPQQFSKEQTLSLTIKEDYKKFSNENRKFFKDFLFMNILKPGKLWALEGGRLIWTNAFCSSFSEPYSADNNTLEIDLDFTLYDGVWHIADPQKTFLKPYDACSFEWCLEFKDVSCKEAHSPGLCCAKCHESKEFGCHRCECICEYLKGEDSLCYHEKDLENFYWSYCGRGMQIIYNCTVGCDIWGIESMLGQKVCKQELCEEYIAGNFYSQTIVDTNRLEITLVGSFENPEIQINDNTMIVPVKGHGRLCVKGNGAASFYEDDCDIPQEISNAKMIIPCGNTFGWMIHHGQNSLFVNTGECKNMTCVYVKTDDLTL